MHGILEVDRLLARPTTGRAVRRARLEFRDGAVRSVGRSRGTAGEGLLALPAMVNAHDHGYGIAPLDQGIADDALECWIVGLKGRISVDPWLEALVAFGRMALAGIGSTVHCHNSLRADRLPSEAEAVARAASEIGIRVAFACPILDRNPWIYGDAEDFLPLVPPKHREYVRRTAADAPPALRLVDQVEEIAQAVENEFFRVQYGPIGPQWCRDETLERIAENSARQGRRIHMHLLESPRQRRWLDAAYPQGIVRHLDEIGFLSPRLGVAHGVHLREDEAELLASRGVSVAVNASSNLRYRSGVAPVSRFLERGLPFGFGLDGAAHDDDQDYLRDLRLVARLHAGCGMTHDLNPEALFTAAFRDGFRMIDGSDDYGTLEVGSRADVLVLDYDSMTSGAVEYAGNETDVLLARGRAEHVRDLFVAGRQAVRDGVLTGTDLSAATEELVGKARRAAAERPREETQRLSDLRESVRSYYSRR